MGRPKGSKNKLSDADKLSEIDVDPVVISPESPTVSAHIVQPTVKFVGDDKKHALQAIFDGPEDKMPVIKSVGTIGVPGTNTWISFIMHTKGTKVIKVDADEPNLRAIAEESAKISFVDTFMSAE